MNNDLPVKRIAIFASGSGTNAENIIRHFRHASSVKIEIIVCNNAKALVLERTKKFNIPSMLIGKKEFYQSDRVVLQLQQLKIDLVVLAGFLWLIPVNLIRAFPDRVINIHPALLPEHGGKGMYGMKVHQAVIDAGDPETGITIHYVNEQYDAGKIIFQSRCPVEPDDSPDTLAAKVHRLEYEHFPRVVEEVLQEMQQNK